MSWPEERATQLLAELPPYVWDGSTLPVPVEEIAESHACLRICEAPDLRTVPGAPPIAGDDALSGLLVVDERRIWVNATEAASSSGRRRFTIGHELGHWYLHAVQGQSERIFCRAHAVHEATAGPAEPDIEEEASLFASALLFPDDRVREEHERLGGDFPLLRERFGGSKVATERAVFRAVRLPAVRAVTDAVTCFFHDDAGYEAWRSAHVAIGFTVNDDLAEPDRARLHRLSCSYLSGPARAEQPRTRHPKWCATDPDVLRRALPHARSCGRCRP